MCVCFTGNEFWFVECASRNRTVHLLVPCSYGLTVYSIVSEYTTHYALHAYWRLNTLEFRPMHNYTTTTTFGHIPIDGARCIRASSLNKIMRFDSTTTPIMQYGTFLMRRIISEIIDNIVVIGYCYCSTADAKICRMCFVCICCFEQNPKNETKIIHLYSSSRALR